jgi:hypothetical protein
MSVCADIFLVSDLVRYWVNLGKGHWVKAKGKEGKTNEAHIPQCHNKSATLIHMTETFKLEQFDVSNGFGSHKTRWFFC